MNKLNYLLLLSSISGILGISYEVLFIKILSNYFGDIYYISSAVIVSFLIGIGLGALYSTKFYNKLILIETLNTIYSTLFILVFYFYGFEIINFLFLNGLYSPLISTLIVSLIILIPGVLIGFTLPLYTIYLESLSVKKIDSSSSNSLFKLTYLFYNFSPAIFILLLEFSFYREFGLYNTLLGVIILNIALIIALLFIKSPKKIPMKINDSKIISYDYISLILISLVSGAFQVFFLKLTFYLYGPQNENFSIVLFTVLIGIAIGTYLIKNYQITIKKYLLFYPIVLMIPFILISPFIDLWSFVQSTFAIRNELSWLFKIIFIFVLGIIPFSYFGISPIVYLNNRKYSDYNMSKILAIISFSNALGFFLMIFLIHPLLNDILIPIFLVIVSYIAFLIYPRKMNLDKFFILSFILLLILFLFVISWPMKLLYIGYTPLSYQNDMKYFKETGIEVENYKYFIETTSIVVGKDKNIWLTHNGYRSLSIGSKENLFKEYFAGMSSSLLTEKRNSSLVIGLGTGITASSVAEFYNNTDVVEINPNMLEVSKLFPFYNFNISYRDDVNIIINDGISQILKPNKYDLILMTASSPYYFSASKLWTKEFLEIAKSRLNNGGVFTTWADMTMGVDEIKSLSKTLDDSFNYCLYQILHERYYIVVCSDEKFEFNNIDDKDFPKNLKEVLYVYNVSDNYSDFLKNLFINPNSTLFDSRDIEINTLNKPVLEFSHLYQRQEFDSLDKKTYLNNFIQSNLDINPFSNEYLSKEDLKNKCEDIYTISGVFKVDLDKCEEVLNE